MISFAATFREQWVVQKFLPAVKKGDKRIILIDGAFAAPSTGCRRPTTCAPTWCAAARRRKPATPPRAPHLRDHRPGLARARAHFRRHRRDRRLPHRDQRHLPDRHPRHQETSAGRTWRRMMWDCIEGKRAARWNRAATLARPATCNPRRRVGDISFIISGDVPADGIGEIDQILSVRRNRELPRTSIWYLEPRKCIDRTEPIGDSFKRRLYSVAVHLERRRIGQPPDLRGPIPPLI